MSTDETPVQNEENQQRARALSLQSSRPPLEVAGYEAEHLLGRGAFGEVWVAVHRNTGCRRAIKFFTRRGGLDWSLLTREVEKLRALDNDRHVVQLVAVGWEANPPYYVMEYVEPGSLEERLEAGPLPLASALPLFRELAVGLSHAHDKGILHCDLKPANVLLGPDDVPRLADFGQARLPHEAAPALGTWFYMAPEQADLQAVPEARWDVYALGAVFYHMITGELPYQTPEAAEALRTQSKLEDRLRYYRRHVRIAPPPPAHRRVPGMDRALAEVIERCLARDPEKRFPNVPAVLAALDARALRRARRPLLLLGALGPAVLLALVAFAASLGFWEGYLTTEAEMVERAQAGNRLLARMAADRVAYRVAQRRAFLEREAAAPEFQELLRKCRGKPKDAPARRQLQAYLDRRHGLYDCADFNDPWLLTDADGRMLAVSGAPESQESIYDHYFWFRDYFHGRGGDFAATEADQHRPRPPDVAPLDRPHQSLVFENPASASRPLVVVFSVPVPAPPRSEALGVLGTAVRLGGFHELETGVENKWICLVQTHGAAPEAGAASPRPWKSGLKNEGLFLEHRELEEARARDEAPTPRHLLPEQVRQLRDLGERKADKLRGEGGDRFETLRLDAYQDAVGLANGKYNDRWLASAEPVVFRWREPGAAPDEVVNHGWVVIVQERYGEVVRPARELYQRLALKATGAFALAILLVVTLWAFVLVGLNDVSRSRLAAWIRRRAGISVPWLAGESSALEAPRARSTVVRRQTERGAASETPGRTP